MSKVKSYSIYEEYFELITLLTEEEQAYLLLAINKYMFYDEKPNLNANQMKIFNNLKRPLDKSKNKSKSTSNKNQNEIKLKSNKNQNKIKTRTHQDVNVIVNDNVYVNKEDRDRGMGEEEETYNNLFLLMEENFGRTFSSIEIEEISKWEDTELTRYAIAQAVLNGKRNIKYISRILESYKSKGIKTIFEAQKDDEEFRNKNKLKEKETPQEIVARLKKEGRL